MNGADALCAALAGSPAHTCPSRHSGPVCRRSPRPSTSRRSVWRAGPRMRPISAALLTLTPPSEPQPGSAATAFGGSCAGRGLHRSPPPRSQSGVASPRPAEPPVDCGARMLPSAICRSRATQCLEARRRSVAAPGRVSRRRPRPMGGWLRGCEFLTARVRLPARCVDPVA